MPANPTLAQQTASRRNGTRSAGPRNTKKSRLNAQLHGFTATIRPPEDAGQRNLYDQLLGDLYEELLPCGPVEWTTLEAIVGLELRRIRIQEALGAEFDFTDEADLKRLGLLSRYETDTINKLEKQWKRLRELQSQRAQRRGLSLESALIQHELEAHQQRAQHGSLDLAERALSRELADLSLPPEQAARVTVQMLGPVVKRRPSGSPAEPPGSIFGSDAEDEDDDLGPCSVPEVLPGPPWDPWRGVPREQLEAWNDELIERKKTRLRRELEALEGATDPPEELAALPAGGD